MEWNGAVCTYILLGRKGLAANISVAVSFLFFLLGFFGLLVWFVSLRAKTERRNDVKQGKCVNEAKYND